MVSDDAAPLVDSHLHIWRRDDPLTDNVWYVPTSDASIEDCLSHLDRNGIVFAVIAAASLHGEYIEYVRSALAANRRLRATCILPPTADLYRMERMKGEGFVGVRLMRTMTTGSQDFSGDWRMHFRRVADLGWHIHLIDTLDRVADSIAGVEASGAPLVIDHMGVGNMDCPDGVNNPGFKAVLAAVERGNTWVKLSSGFRMEQPGLAQALCDQLLRVAGPDRLLWGSDWPFAGIEDRMTYDGAIDTYRSLVPDPKVRGLIDRTALRFYFG